MVRPEKVAVVEEVAETLSDSAAVLLTDYRGLGVEELAELRSRLREADASYRVVKNTLTSRAVGQVGMEGLDEYLTGPTAIVFCQDGPVGPAKALRNFSAEHPDLAVKAGFLDGEVLDAETAAGLADLRSREELLTSLAGMMDGALSGFARMLRAKVLDFARLLDAYRGELAEQAPEGGGADADEPSE